MIRNFCLFSCSTIIQNITSRLETHLDRTELDLECFETRGEAKGLRGITVLQVPLFSIIQQDKDTSAVKETGCRDLDISLVLRSLRNEFHKTFINTTYWSALLGAKLQQIWVRSKEYGGIYAVNLIHCMLLDIRHVSKKEKKRGPYGRRTPFKGYYTSELNAKTRISGTTFFFSNISNCFYFG